MNETSFVRLQDAYPHMVKQKLVHRNEEIQQTDLDQIKMIPYLENMIQDLKKQEEKNNNQNEAKIKSIEEKINQLRDKDLLSIKDSLNVLVSQGIKNNNLETKPSSIHTSPLSDTYTNPFWENTANISLIQSIIIGKIHFNIETIF